MNPILSTEIDKPVAVWKCAQYHISLYAPSQSTVSKPSPPVLHEDHLQKWHVVVREKTNSITCAILEWPHGKAFQKRLAGKPEQIELIRASLQRNFYPLVTQLTNKDGDKEFLVNLFVRGLGGAPPVFVPQKEPISPSIEVKESEKSTSEKEASNKTWFQSITERFLSKKRSGYNSFSSLPEDIEQIVATINKAEVITEEFLNCGVLRDSSEIVEMMLEKGAIPSRLTLHLARFIGNEKVLFLLDEVSPLVREENEAFEKEEFRQFLKYISKTKELDLKDHQEITDEYFFFGGIFSPIPSLQKLNLSGCLKITDRGLEQIGYYFPHLHDLNLSLPRHYQDILVLMTTENTFYSEHCHIERRPGSITERGIRHLAKNCKNLRRLSLAARYNLPKAIVDLLNDPSTFPLLEFLDLSDCYAIKQNTLEGIKKARPSLRIQADRLFSESTVPDLIKAAESHINKPLSSPVLNKLYRAIDDEKYEEAFTIFTTGSNSDQVSIESTLEEHTWEDVLLLAIKKSDFLIADGVLRRGTKDDLKFLEDPESEVLKYAIVNSNSTEVLGLLLYAHVPPAEGLVKLALAHREDKNHSDLFLSRTPLSEDFLNEFIVHQYNAFKPFKKFMLGEIKFTDKTLYLSAQHNHLRIMRLLIQHGLHPTEEVLNAAVRHNTPRAVEYLLNQGMQPTLETMQEAQLRGSTKIRDLLLKYHSELSNVDELLSPKEKKNVILYGTWTDVRDLVEKEITISDDLLHIAVQRDSYFVVKMLLDKGARASHLSLRIAQFNSSWTILKLLQAHKKKEDDSLSQDETFNQLVNFCKRTTTLNLEGWDKLSDACFHPSNELRSKLPAVSSLCLVDCSALHDETLINLAENFPGLTSLDISASLPNENGVRKMGNFTKKGIQSLKNCLNLQTLCLQFRHDIVEDIKNMLMNPDFLPKLQFLDILNCNESIAQSIRKNRPNLYVLS